MPNPNRTSKTIASAVLLVLAGLAGTWSVAADGPAADLPLAETVFPGLEGILRQALGQSPRMIQAQLDRDEAEGWAVHFSSRLYPDVGSTVQYNLQSGDRYNSGGQDATDRIYYYLRLTQPLYHWGAVSGESRRGKIAAAMKANDVREAYRLLALDLRSQFLQLVVSSVALRNARHDLEVRRKRLVLFRAQLAEGQATPGAVLGTERGIEDLEFAIERMEFNLDSAVRRFRRTSGCESFTLDQVPGDIPKVAAVSPERTAPLRANYVERNGFEDRIAYANTLLTIDRERIAHHRAKTDLRPRFNLQVQANQEQLRFGAGTQRNYDVRSFFAGIEMQWNIFDGWSSRGRARALSASIRSLEQRLETARADLLEAAETAMLELRFASRSLELAERRAREAAANLADARKRFADGRITESDVLDAEIGGDQAVLGAVSSRANYLGALATFLSTVEADPMVAALAPKAIRKVEPGRSLGERLYRP